MVLNTSTAASKGLGAFSVDAASKAAVRNSARGWATDLKEGGFKRPQDGSRRCPPIQSFTMPRSCDCWRRLAPNSVQTTTPDTDEADRKMCKGRYHILIQ
jgi:hypothetical protein